MTDVRSHDPATPPAAPGRSSDAASRRWRRIVVQPLSAVERSELRRGIGAAGGSRRRVSGLLGRFLLADVVNRALGSLVLDELLQRLVALAADTLDAERATIFLVDAERDEVFSRVVQGGTIDEIRIPRQSGIAGAVLASGSAELVDDAYADPRFNPGVDQHSGYRTHSLACVPLARQDGDFIGVIEVLNKRQGRFDNVDLILLEAIAQQAAAALAHAQAFETERHERQQDQRMLKFAEAVAVELDLDRLLSRIVVASAELLGAERATFFVHDPVAGELWSRVTAGERVKEIRFPADTGIAGAALASGTSIVVGDAHSDRRFNSAIDAQTGFATRSLIAIPVLDRSGTPTAVLEVLNKRAGAFTTADERRLRAFAAQAAIALQNAQLFTDVLALKNYTESLLRSLPDGVITLDRQFTVMAINEAAQKMLGVASDAFSGRSAAELWGATNPWLGESLTYVAHTGRADHRLDVDFAFGNGQVMSANVTAAPQKDAGGALAGVTLIVENIDRQKKVRATITRYMAKEFAEQALSGDAAAASGALVFATMLFSDIRRFTSLTEALTAQATVDMLNEYFGEMAEIVQQHGGVLDKYIGDAVMAVFGAPVSGPDDADHAAATASEMIRRLRALNQRRLSRGAQPLEIGVGIASGEIVAGPVGSPARKNYTVIGDSVNLAARLESANKYYATSVLMAGATVERIVVPVLVRRVDLIRVKGQEAPTEIFELLDHHEGEMRARYNQVAPIFDEGIRRYRAREWSRALASFADVLKALPNDGPSWVYTDRCLYYRDNPPPGHWDGVWTMKTK